MDVALLRGGAWIEIDQHPITGYDYASHSFAGVRGLKFEIVGLSNAK